MFIDESFTPRNPEEAEQLASLRRMLSEWKIDLLDQAQELPPIQQELGTEIKSTSFDSHEEKEDDIEENIANSQFTIKEIMQDTVDGKLSPVNVKWDAHEPGMMFPIELESSYDEAPLDIKAEVNRLTPVIMLDDNKNDVPIRQPNFSKSF